MAVVVNILFVVVVLVCVAIDVFILMQKKRSAGLSGAFSGMGGAGQTYADKNKGRTFEGRLERYTKILAVVFLLMSLALNFLR